MPLHVCENTPTVGTINIQGQTINPDTATRKILTGTVIFNNVKKANIVFITPFTKVPRLSFSQYETSLVNPFSSGITLNGFSINFQSPYTGTIEWIAIERE